MADSTTVNPQITDAMTQGTAKALAEAPAMSVGTLYQTLAESTGLLFQNAVNAQQQQNVIAQAATTQGVMQIYSVDTPATGPKPDVASSPETLRTDLSRAADAANSTLTAHADSIDALVASAAKLSNHAVLGHAGDVAYAVRASADALAAAMHAIGHTLHEDRMRMLRTAATAACVAGMLRDPSKLAEYQSVLATIEDLR